jgi:hypothetical protein
VQVAKNLIVDFIVSYNFRHADKVNAHDGGIVHAPAMNVKYAFVEQF